MIRDTDKSYGVVTILFHWIMAGLFFFQFWLGLTMMGEKDAAARSALRAEHMSFGLLILILWVLRALWKVTSKRPHLPTGMESNLRGVARITHWTLFTLLVVTPLTGWAIISTTPLPSRAHLFHLFTLPSLPLKASPNAAGVWSGTHAFLAYGLLFLALVHALAALRHQFKDRDGLLVRMLVSGARLTERESGR